MEIFTIDSIPNWPQRPVITIGTFDGVHLGHVSLIKKTKQIAHQFNTTSMVVTFDTHPRIILQSITESFVLTSYQQKLDLLQKTNVNYCLMLKFDKSLANMDAYDFAINMLYKNLQFKAVVIGNDLKFGHDRQGTPDLLESLGEKFNFSTYVIDKQIFDDEPISSTRLRGLLMEGQFDMFSKLTGRFPTIYGSVCQGDGRGKSMGYPTANISIMELLPPVGVYAVKIAIKSCNYQGMANIGKRPTFKNYQEKDLLEVHIFDFNEQIYDQEIQITFVRKIRDEKHFLDANELKKQLKDDEMCCRTILLDLQ